MVEGAVPETAVLPASMGPQPDGRGWMDYDQQALVLLSQLQWGRNLTVADGGWAVEVGVVVTGFNGAAT